MRRRTPRALVASVLALAWVGVALVTLPSSQVNGMAARVAAAGIRHVTGSLVVDDTLFDRVRQPDGWKPYYVPEESGPLSALSIDGNRWRSDAAFIADPATANGDRFR